VGSDLGLRQVVPVGVLPVLIGNHRTAIGLIVILYEYRYNDSQLLIIVTINQKEIKYV
jgi:hypothetical protein